MLDAAALQNQTLCPEGTHRVFAGENATGSLRELPADLHHKLVEMLCDVAEVAERGPSAVDFWRDESILWLRAGGVMLLYSVDRKGRVVVHHVLANPDVLSDAR